MVIAQITDIHISPDLKPVHEVDVRANFLKALKDVLDHKEVGHLVITGDLCYQDPLLSIMEWVKASLDETGLTYSVIPGNHDDSVIMAQVFDLEHCLQANELYYNEVKDDLHLIFLDSGKGTLSVDQISWLKAVDSVIELPSLIFMHHPPVDAVPYMDNNYALDEKNAVMETLSGLKHPVAVFCGHYHVAKEVSEEAQLPVYITPSTFFQIDDRIPDFRISTHDIGWRRIELRDGNLLSEVKWLTPADNPE